MPFQKKAIQYSTICVADLKRYRHVQRLAYDCVEFTAASLRTGMTERHACAIMKNWLKEHGVDDLFHDPFAWFGDRAAFKGFWADHKFLPSDRQIEEGMPGILDIAPIVDGYSADIGYCFVHGRNPGMQDVLDDMTRTLLSARDCILEGVRAGATFRTVYREVDALIKRAGYVNQHKRYPHRVLGHRVGRHMRNPLNKVRWLGFGLPTYLSLMSRQWGSKLAPRLVHSPLWNDLRESDHRPFEGLWAIEPHISLPDQSLGTKWEEILVIADNNAWWLDNDTPHCRQGEQRGWWRPSSESATQVFLHQADELLVLA
ncbi:M24 family metallopeptidase [Burkholderia sp. Ac-20353]|uniref:M24 family metallopeptidase n=1 Tax=Burkholderia sp. Ac-20353 TaxID=2703894 RepID=UPI00197C5446|nr:M24 family metallopeptidase [Burkholderia sp. Ac-20353]MBN3786365.1 aminopeptidase P family protein [Burkholderia sp. Ac-20353]